MISRLLLQANWIGLNLVYNACLNTHIYIITNSIDIPDSLNNYLLLIALKKKEQSGTMQRSHKPIIFDSSCRIRPK